MTTQLKVKTTDSPFLPRLKHQVGPNLRGLSADECMQQVMKAAKCMHEETALEWVAFAADHDVPHVVGQVLWDAYAIAFDHREGPDKGSVIVVMSKPARAES